MKYTDEMHEQYNHDAMHWRHVIVAYECITCNELFIDCLKAENHIYEKHLINICSFTSFAEFIQPPFKVKINPTQHPSHHVKGSSLGGVPASDIKKEKKTKVSQLDTSNVVFTDMDSSRFPKVMIRKHLCIKITKKECDEKWV